MGGRIPLFPYATLSALTDCVAVETMEILEFTFRENDLSAQVGHDLRSVSWSKSLSVNCFRDETKFHTTLMILIFTIPILGKYFTGCKISTGYSLSMLILRSLW